MNKKIKIGIDLDDTLNDLKVEWIHHYNEKYNDTLKCEDINRWEIHEFTKPECGTKIYDLLDGIFYKLGVQQYAIDVVNKWLENDLYEVYIVTAYSAKACLDKKRWVQKYLPNFDVRNIIFLNNKGLLDLDYLIDDSPYNYKGFRGEYIIMNKYHNQEISYPELKGKKRVSDWKEIETYFDTMKKEDLNDIKINNECYLRMTTSGFFLQYTEEQLWKLFHSAIDLYTGGSIIVEDIQIRARTNHVANWLQ